ncbi:response regulator [Profundibacterium mesophilum]|uniref:Response regulator receiver n=1 Tax=Profundibacterium mesophilum KAUST100406-0324 TaxID=1037889 RepID=A0A921NVY2_9RHOB|nr:response regulator [Profundibacterium mesophilum]KAF0676480.1 Response regulator receiver [Profundibacterium mesophilum KAUST100406-0324]
MSTTLRKILHVDDDSDIRTIAKIALETVGGFEVLQCDSGQKALESAEGFDPDLILLDVMMPGMDGEDTLRSLRQVDRLRDTPAIFMTAKANTASRERLLAAGAFDVIVKPFDPMTLASEISETWARKGGRR